MTVAGDWIKVEHAMPDKPEVNQLADVLSIDHDACVGKLVRFWVWADAQSIDGNAIRVTGSFIDRLTNCPGFSAGLLKVGWLKGRNGHFSVPNFDRHNGQTAKKRALSRDRVKRLRSAHGVTIAPPEVEAEAEAEKSDAAATAQCIDRGMQGGKVLPKPDREFVSAAIPGEFIPTLDTILGILQVSDADQIGFLAKLAYADASGFEFPSPIWDYVGRAKRKANKAGYLTAAIRDDMGPERWQEFQSTIPSPSHCQWLLAKAGRERGEP